MGDPLVFFLNKKFSKHILQWNSNCLRLIGQEYYMKNIVKSLQHFLNHGYNLQISN
jgi:hypothetical protein